jgi:GDSL family lipase/acylhydrolase
MRDFPLTHINLISVLPVSQEERYKQKVYVRTNEKIQALNQAYQELAQAYHQVSYVDVYSSLLDEKGQLAEAYTTDGLHLSVAGYRILAQALQETL